MFNRRQKSIIAPTSIIEKETYYILGDTYIRNFLVTALPPEFTLGMLSYYTSNPNIKVLVKTSPLKIDITGPLNKDLRAKEEEYRKTKDAVLQQRLYTQIEGLRNYIGDMIANNDKTLNLIVVFSQRTKSLEDLTDKSKELKASLKMDGFKIEALSMQQLDLFKMTSALFIDNGMSPALIDNIGVPLTTKSFAGLWPYTFETLKDEKGFLFAREKNNSGVILLNPLLYMDNKEASVEQNRLTSNMIIEGASGSGKTTASNLLIRNLIKRKFNIVWVDPENKNSYLTKKYHGTYIQWGSKGNQINLFDLKPVSVDEDDAEQNPYDTELAIYNVIDEFKNTLKLYKPNISDDTLDIISTIVVDMYKDHNIDFTTDFKTLRNCDYPILSDFDRHCEKEQIAVMDDAKNIKRLTALDDLRMKIKPMLTEHKYFFDGHTTISKNLEGRNILSFGTKTLFDKSKELKNSLNYIMFSYIKALCLDESVPSATIFAETHLYLLEGKSAEELAIIWRRSRKYKNCAILDTQEPADLNNDLISVHGRAIMNNSTYKIIMHLEKDAINALDQVLTLNPNEKDAIEFFERGDALLIAGKKHMTINILATQKELEEFDPEDAIK
ncbi:MAG: hypothetical protein RSD85_00085 [Erysipelotrichaceae bacterium]